MKKIRYAVLGYTGVFNPDTEAVEQKESIAYNIIDYSPEAEAKVKEIAYNGDYESFDDEEPKTVVAPRNLTKGEYITISGVMYKTTSNIPNGEHIITGQNAIETTIEKQLAELSKGE